MRNTKYLRAFKRLRKDVALPGNTLSSCLDTSRIIPVLESVGIEADYDVEDRFYAWMKRRGFAKNIGLSRDGMILTSSGYRA